MQKSTSQHCAVTTKPPSTVIVSVPHSVCAHVHMSNAGRTTHVCCPSQVAQVLKVHETFGCHSETAGPSPMYACAGCGHACCPTRCECAYHHHAAVPPHLANTPLSFSHRRSRHARYPSRHYRFPDSGFALPSGALARSTRFPSHFIRRAKPAGSTSRW